MARNAISKGLNFKIFTGRQYQTQAFSQKGVQASWDAPRTKKWTPLDAQILGKKCSIIGLFQKTSIPPPRRKLEVNPPTPFGCPNTFTIIRNNFFSPPPPDGRNFLRGGSVDLFWNDPFP
jgi:hypothetical protein